MKEKQQHTDRENILKLQINENYQSLNMEEKRPETQVCNYLSLRIQYNNVASVQCMAFHRNALVQRVTDVPILYF